MHISFEYDRSYLPSFPVMELTLIGSGSNGRQLLRGLVDSGSDATQIPLSVLQAIQARDIDDRWVQEASGTRHLVTMYAVKLQIGTVELPGMEVIGQKHTQEVIIGRDVLNYFIVTLNGLALVTDITD